MDEADLPRGRRGFSVRAGAELRCGFGLKMAEPEGELRAQQR